MKMFNQLLGQKPESEIEQIPIKAVDLLEGANHLSPEQQTPRKKKLVTKAPTYKQTRVTRKQATSGKKNLANSNQKSGTKAHATPGDEYDAKGATMPLNLNRSNQVVSSFKDFGDGGASESQEYATGSFQ